MKRYSWRYLAGLIDGEGCLDFRKAYGHSGPIKVTPRLRIALVMPCKFVLDNLQLSFGGHMHVRKAPPEGTNWQQAVTWDLQGRKLRPVLQNTFKHMYIKKEQAKLLMFFNDHVLGKRVDGYSNIAEARQLAIDELKAMKADPQRLSEKAERKIIELLESDTPKHGKSQPIISQGSLSL